jgi:hypothetical protein
MWIRAIHRKCKRKENLLQIMLDAKVPCKCGEDHPACLDFHHRDPSTKSFCPNEGIKKCVKPSLMIEELAKCDVLCSNCHRKEHGAKYFKKVEAPLDNGR